MNLYMNNIPFKCDDVFLSFRSHQSSVGPLANVATHREHSRRDVCMQTTVWCNSFLCNKIIQNITTVFRLDILAFFLLLLLLVVIVFVIDIVSARGKMLLYPLMQITITVQVLIKNTAIHTHEWGTRFNFAYAMLKTKSSPILIDNLHRWDWRTSWTQVRNIGDKY